MWEVGYSDLNVWRNGGPKVYRKKVHGGRLSKYQKTNVAKVSRRATNRSAQKEFDDAWLIWIAIETFEAELSNRPARNREDNLKRKRIQSLSKKMSHPKKAEALGRLHGAYLATRDHVRRHGQPANIRKLYVDLIANGALNSGKCYSNGRPHQMSEQAFRDMLKARLNISGRPG